MTVEYATKICENVSLIVIAFTSLQQTNPLVALTVHIQNNIQCILPIMFSVMCAYQMSVPK